MVITLANQVSIYLDRHAAVYSTHGHKGKIFVDKKGEFSWILLGEFSWTFLVTFRGQSFIVMIRVTSSNNPNLTQT